MKICNICKTDKDLSEFYKNIKGTQGVLNCCKKCSEIKKKKRLEDPAYAEKVRQQRKASSKNNKETVNKKRREKYKENPLAALESAKQYYKENVDRIKEQRRSRDVEDINSVRRKHRELHRQRITDQVNKWRSSNRHKLSMNQARREAIKKRAIPSWSSDEWEEFLVEEVYHLSKLRSNSTGIKFEVDHIVPLNSKTVCGLHCSSNLRIIPKIENTSKGNRWWPDMPVEEKQETSYNANSQTNKGNYARVY